MMRTFELRVYTLRTKEARDFYAQTIYPRHVNSFPLYAFAAHGSWTAKDDVQPWLFVLASYAAGEEPGDVAQKYMQSTESADDSKALMLRTTVQSTILLPSESSPLQ